MLTIFMVKLLHVNVKKENEELPQLGQSTFSAPIFFFPHSPRNDIKFSDRVATCFSVVQFIVPLILIYSNVP